MTTSDNISAIEAVEKAMEGVTPGVWEAKQNAYGAAFIYGGETLTTSVGTEYKELVAGGNSHDTLKMADAAYIAACSPDRISAILAEARKAEALKREIAEKDARIAVLEEVLKPFAECAGEWDGEPESLHVFFEWNDENAPVPSLPVADFRRARTLLNGGSDAHD